MKRLCLGAARWICSSFTPASHSFSGSAISFSACCMAFAAHCCCARTTRSTSGFISSNRSSSRPSTGPEMMSGVRASSISTESTSSTIA